MALAEFKAKRKQTSDGQDPRPVLTKRCFEVVPNVTIEFNAYLKATRGFDEAGTGRRGQLHEKDKEEEQGLLRF